MSASKWNSYPNYTESNSEFIPQYPSHWELKRMQWIGKFSASGIDKKSVETESDCFMVNYTDVYGNETAEIHSNQEFMKERWKKELCTTNAEYGRSEESKRTETANKTPRRPRPLSDSFFPRAGTNISLLRQCEPTAPHTISGT